MSGRAAKSVGVLGAMVACAAGLGACYHSTDRGGDVPAEVESGDPCADPDDAYFCCDPDDCPCECYGNWDCDDTATGGLECVQLDPELPDDGGMSPWDCVYEADWISCTGLWRDHPYAGQDGRWDCQFSPETITCRRPLVEGDMPLGPAWTYWDCSFSPEASSRTCRAEHEEGDEWVCSPLPGQRRRCENASPGPPSDSEWTCYRTEDEDVCVGEEAPDDPGAWDCRLEDEAVVCVRPGMVPNDEEAWDCQWGWTILVCESDGDLPPPGCEPCVVGSQRWCSGPDWGGWGAQTCGPRAGEVRWSRCDPVDEIPAGCEPGGTNAGDYEWHYRGGYWDGMVNDPDGDGVVVVPAGDWYDSSAEDCGIRAGSCVADYWDLDLDGDIDDSLGDCGAPECR
ncbi:MAG: hypothetical protein HYY06_07065 [Deltaproteobacteria bacterium]|nr:hypothetical protein [Deltaproteobacteria bacterium]